MKKNRNNENKSRVTKDISGRRIIGLTLLLVLIIASIWIGPSTEAAQPFNTYLGQFRTVEARSNSGSTNPQNFIDHYLYGQVSTGLRWECVEYMRRFYLSALNLHVVRTGASTNNGKDWYPNAANIEYRDGATTHVGFDSFANDTVTRPPAAGDILGYSGSVGGGFGHVAIIKRVRPDYILTAQENWNNEPSDLDRRLTLTRTNGRYKVNDTGVQGWLRPRCTAKQSNALWHPDGTLLVEPSGAVWLIEYDPVDRRQERRHVPNEWTFVSRGWSWCSLIATTTSELNSYTVGEPVNDTERVIRRPDGAIFRVNDRGYKQVFNSLRIFDGLGYSMSEVQQLTTQEVNQIPDDPAATRLSAPFPEGTLVRDGSNPNDQTIWVVTDGGRRAFASGEAFQLLGYDFNRVLLIDSATFIEMDNKGSAIDMCTATLSCGGAIDEFGPNLSITSHSNNQTVSTASITLSGTASDAGRGESGISSVTVNGVRANGDTATGSGTANWSISVSLAEGSNTITVRARDASPDQNLTQTTLTINRSSSSGCSYSLSSSGNTIGPGNGGGSFFMDTTTGCSWSATSDSTSWLTTSSSGTGDGRIDYSFVANTSTSSRTGRLTVAGQVYTVTQIGVGGSGSVQFSSATYTANESGGVLTITVTRQGGTYNGTINYSTSDGTAIGGTDYTPTSGLLFFGENQNSRTFDIQILNDAVSEGSKTINLSLTNPSTSFTLGNPNTATVTIIDDDSSPTPTPSLNDQVWVEDSVPAGATVTGFGEGWNWIGSSPSPFSGSLAHQSNIVAGLHNHYFSGATQTMTVSTGDKLFAYAYIDPNNLPSELMLQWNDGSVWRNAYWGADNITSVNRTFVGALPASGQWVRLEVAASVLGLEGKTISGMAFNAFGGRVTWDRAGKTVSSTPVEIWVDDSVPAGATATGFGEGWNWIGSNPNPSSGLLAHQSNIVSGLHNHYFSGATQTLAVGTGEKLFANAYIDPNNVPSELMLQWNDGSVWHNAYWGADNITSVNRTFVGPLPASGQWVRLEVAASVLGLEGKTLSGMAFNAYGGRVTWDYAGKTVNTSPEEVWVEDSVPTGATVTGSGEGWNWISSSPSPFSGSLAHQSNLAAGLHNHYFFGATQTLAVNTGNKLYCYVYLDPANPPSELMLQWNDGSVWHNAYWGADNITSVNRTFVGPLPASGQWVRLEVAASVLGLEGKTISGMAFNAYGGRVTWDRAGKVFPTPQRP